MYSFDKVNWQKISGGRLVMFSFFLLMMNFSTSLKSLISLNFFFEINDYQLIFFKEEVEEKKKKQLFFYAYQFRWFSQGGGETRKRRVNKDISIYVVL